MSPADLQNLLLGAIPTILILQALSINFGWCGDQAPTGLLWPFTAPPIIESKFPYWDSFHLGGHFKTGHLEMMFDGDAASPKKDILDEESGGGPVETSPVSD
jgi:hypothetical protein